MPNANSVSLAQPLVEKSWRAGTPSHPNKKAQSSHNWTFNYLNQLLSVE
ncbi:hypothetical protein [Nostoc sp.]